MLENREISVRLNRKDQGSKGMPSENNKAFEDKVIFLEKVAHRMAKQVGIGVCAYVLLDTFRKVVVERSTKF